MIVVFYYISAEFLKRYLPVDNLELSTLVINIRNAKESQRIVPDQTGPVT